MTCHLGNISTRKVQYYIQILAKGFNFFVTIPILMHRCVFYVWHLPGCSFLYSFHHYYLDFTIALKPTLNIISSLDIHLLYVANWLKQPLNLRRQIREKISCPKVDFGQVEIQTADLLIAMCAHYL